MFTILLFTIYRLVPWIIVFIVCAAGCTPLS